MCTLLTFVANVTFRCSLRSAWLLHRAGTPAAGTWQRMGADLGAGSPRPHSCHRCPTPGSWGPKPGTEATLRLPPRLGGEGSEETKPPRCFDPINCNLFCARQRFPAGGFAVSPGCAISGGRSRQRKPFPSPDRHRLSITISTQGMQTFFSGDSHRVLLG